MPSACSVPNKGLSPSPARACLGGYSGCRGGGARPGWVWGEFGGSPYRRPRRWAAVCTRHKDGGCTRHKDGGRRRAPRVLPNTKMTAREALWLRTSEGSAALTSSMCDAAGPRGSWRGRTEGPRDQDRERPPRSPAGPPRLRPRLGGGGKAARSGRRRWWPSRGASPSRDGCGRIPGRRGGQEGPSFFGGLGSRRIFLGVIRCGRILRGTGLFGGLSGPCEGVPEVSIGFRKDPDRDDLEELPRN